MYNFREWSISLDLYKNKLHSKEYFVKDITKQNKRIKKQTKKKTKHQHYFLFNPI